MKKQLTLGLITLFSIAGCAAPQAGNDPVASENLSQEQIQTLSPKEVIERSKAQFDSTGMTEAVFSGGDNYILTYEPGQTFVAALYNESFDDVIAIDQPELFTVVAAFNLSQNSAVEYVETDCGFEISAPDSPGMSVCVEDDLIVSGNALDGSWEGTFEYSVNQEILAMIAESD
jgi:hypothetical protein